jgi:hypothetical protein
MDGQAVGSNPKVERIWRRWLPGFLATFVAALLGVLMAEYLIARWNVLEPFLRTPSADYKDVVLLASRVLPSVVYVRFRNTGTRTITGASFVFKYYEAGQLVEESSEAYFETVARGQTTEGIITPERIGGPDELTPIPLTGRTVRVVCTGGYTED